jgi:hypothetical protein
MHKRYAMAVGGLVLLAGVAWATASPPSLVGDGYDLLRTCRNAMLAIDHQGSGDLTFYMGAYYCIGMVQGMGTLTATYKALRPTQRRNMRAKHNRSPS